jgi:hypothetical protein
MKPFEKGFTLPKLSPSGCGLRPVNIGDREELAQHCGQCPTVFLVFFLGIVWFN